MADPGVGLVELEEWVARCQAAEFQLTELSDDDLRAHYTVMLVVRMFVFSHEPASGEMRDPLVHELEDRLGPCLDAAYAEADRRGWAPRTLREAARQVLSPAAGGQVDPVALLRDWRTGLPRGEGRVPQPRPARWLPMIQPRPRAESRPLPEE